MQGSLRQHIRAAIDARARELALDGPRCSNCEGHADLKTPGCRTCTNRHLRRKWRLDEAYRQRDLAQRTQRKRRQRIAA